MMNGDSSGDPSTTPEWAALSEHARHLTSVSLTQLLDGDPDRYARLSIMVDDEFLADFSRCRVDSTALELLQRLAASRGIAASIERLFDGDLINTTEERAALHTSLRASAAAGPLVAGEDTGALVSAELSRVVNFADAVRTGARGGHSGGRFTRVINIGIGGSDLGPRFVSAALRGRDDEAGPDVRYVAGLDGIELAAALAGADPHATLFIVCSKTFSTLETLSNARAARNWLRATLSAEQAVRHFAAVSVNAAAMDDFGVADDARFAMWDWVGGRYSVWSPVGLAAAIALGGDGFRHLLAGARVMDEHFRSTPAARNLPLQMALMAVWHQNFLGLRQHVVLPYDQRLAGLPDYLQQLWMESLGKSVRTDGESVDYATGASLWGSSGSSAQHSFAQWLHQGTAGALVDYIGTALGPGDIAGDGHLQSLANMIAQAEVLARGRQADGADDALEAHRAHPGNRPSVLLLLKRLTPHSLGMLLAAYEHSVYVQSCIWGINAFDQYGVEQGKLVARAYAKSLINAERDKLPGIAGQILDWQKG